MQNYKSGIFILSFVFRFASFLLSLEIMMNQKVYDDDSVIDDVEFYMFWP
jgi:hypothetical protein